MKTADPIILKTTTRYALLQAAPWTALAALLLILAWTLSSSFMLFALPVMGFAVYRLLSVSRYAYCIDQEQIRYTHGLLWRKTMAIDLRHCKYYTIHSSSLSRALHCRDLTIRTEGHEPVVIILKGFASESLLEMIRERIIKSRKSRPSRINAVHEASETSTCSNEESA